MLPGELCVVLSTGLLVLVLALHLLYKSFTQTNQVPLFIDIIWEVEPGNEAKARLLCLLRRGAFVAFVHQAIYKQAL